MMHGNGSYKMTMIGNQSLNMIMSISEIALLLWRRECFKERMMEITIYIKHKEIISGKTLKHLASMFKGTFIHK